MRIGILNNIKNNNYIDYDLNFINSITELKSNYLTIFNSSTFELANMPSAKVGTIVYLRPKTDPVTGVIQGGLITIKGSANIIVPFDFPLTSCVTLRCAGTNWEVINKVGSQGAKGYQGAQGIQGTQGSQGDQGIQGIQGKDSDIGPQGLPGFTGSQGGGGDQGPVGDPGDPGLPGAPGAQGG